MKKAPLFHGRGAFFHPTFMNGLFKALSLAILGTFIFVYFHQQSQIKAIEKENRIIYQKLEDQREKYESKIALLRSQIPVEDNTKNLKNFIENIKEKLNTEKQPVYDTLQKELDITESQKIKIAHIVSTYNKKRFYAQLSFQKKEKHEIIMDQIAADIYSDLSKTLTQRQFDLFKAHRHGSQLGIPALHH